MFESITPNARVVADSARAFARKLKHGYVGREHLLYAFASGAGGDIIRTAFEACGLSESAVHAAIDFVDGGKHPHARMRQRLVNPVLAEHHMGSPMPASLTARQRFAGFSANAEAVLTMAIKEAKERGAEPGFEDILLVFLREAERSDDDRRVMRVIHHAAPELTLSDIKSAMVASLNAVIDEMESKYGKVIIVMPSKLSESHQEIARLKRLRHAFTYTGHMQEA